MALPYLITPSITPIYKNNPGVSYIDLNSNYKITKGFARFFNIIEYTYLGIIRYSDVDVMKDFGVDLNNCHSIRHMTNKLEHNAYWFGVFSALRYGENWLVQQIIGFLFPIYKYIHNSPM